MAKAELIQAEYLGSEESQVFSQGVKYTLNKDTADDGKVSVMVVGGGEDQAVLYYSEEEFTADWRTIPTDVLKEKEEPQQRQISVLDTQASGILDPNTWLQMKSIANDFFKSGVAPKAFQNPLQILMALQMGKEMGMQPAESLQSLTVINGIFGVWGKAVPNRLRQHGWSVKYDEGGEGDEQYCTATISRTVPDGVYGLNQHLESFTETITFKEVEQSGYTKDKYGKLKPGWLPGLNRRLKLRYDVLDVLIKTYVPEVYGAAAGVAEMLQDIPESAINDGKSKSQQRREQIMAAEARRADVSDGDFKPSAVEGTKDASEKTD